MTPSNQTYFNSTVLKLKALYADEEARAMADRLFEHYLGLTPAKRIISGKEPADNIKISLIDTATEKLLKHIPLQYALGKAWFMDMEFDVNPSVLIPRPETEELVSLILKECSKNKTIQPQKILDIGTGSGCIAIALKHFIPAVELTAVDISENALIVASVNAANNKTEVQFIRADILDQTQWGLLPKCDLIVSNPPYVTDSEKQFLQANVIDNEPHTALFVPNDDPLVFYRLIFAFSRESLNPNGSLWFEINEKFGAELKDLAISQGFMEANIIFDFRGKSRFLHCSK